MLVFKDCQTGELLGPSAPFWPPSRAVYAVPEGSGWREVTKPRVHIAEGIAAHWARLHTARTGLRSLAEADGVLAHHIGVL